MVNDQMVHIHLPISKSIANRILLLQAIHGDPLMRVSSDMPDDVIVLHDALQQIRDIFGTPEAYASSPSSPLHGGTEGGLGLSLKNCGTALRFLQVHIAKCYPGAPITLTGDPRLMERNGAPTTQTTSALILHGEPIPVSPDESPYITMSRRIRESYSELRERSYSETVLQRSVQYFPSYEILLDELRDYRFYADDLVHPSSLAVNYIWEHFADTFCTPQTRNEMTLQHKRWKFEHHRPLH